MKIYSEKGNEHKEIFKNSQVFMKILFFGNLWIDLAIIEYNRIYRWLTVHTMWDEWSHQG